MEEILTIECVNVWNDQQSWAWHGGHHCHRVSEPPDDVYARGIENWCMKASIAVTVPVFQKEQSTKVAAIPLGLKQ